MSDLPPKNDVLKYMHVAGPEEETAPDVEDFEDRLFHNKDEADLYCYYHNQSIEAARKHRFGQKAQRYKSYTVPVTVHWGDLH